MSAFQDRTNPNSHLQPIIHYTKVPSTPQDYLLICLLILTGIRSIFTSDNVMYGITLLA